MAYKLEDLIRIAYRNWKDGFGKVDDAHLSEEDLACFIEGRLPAKEAREIERHLVHCGSCMRLLALTVKLEKVEPREVPPQLLEQVERLTQSDALRGGLLEIVLSLKGRVLEVLDTTGDILVGNEFLPVPVLRSRSKVEFRDGITILKDLKNIRVEIKVESKKEEEFNLYVLAKEKYSQRPLKDIRISLTRDNQDLESYIAPSGFATFEHFSTGEYGIKLSGPEGVLASVTIEIRAKNA